MTRRWLQVVLGALWILDGALQLQPFMFGPGFARQVIAPAGTGQPGFVSSGVKWSANLIAAHPVPWDVLFALTQLAIGAGLLLGRSKVAKAGLAASMAWALGVWYFGEGLGGIASGQFDLVNGAPGAVLLYAVLAAAAWPTSARDQDDRPPSWLVVPWGLLWLWAALWMALPAQQGPAALAEDLRGSAEGSPGRLAALDRTVGAHLHTIGTPGAAFYVLLLAGIGLGGLVPGTSRRVAAGAAILLATLMWILGQSVGELATGQATDPNSAPLLVLFALALASVQPARSARPAMDDGTVPLRSVGGETDGPQRSARVRFRRSPRGPSAGSA